MGAPPRLLTGDQRRLEFTSPYAYAGVSAFVSWRLANGGPEHMTGGANRDRGPSSTNDTDGHEPRVDVAISPIGGGNVTTVGPGEPTTALPDAEGLSSRPHSDASGVQDLGPLRAGSTAAPAIRALERSGVRTSAAEPRLITTVGAVIVTMLVGVSISWLAASMARVVAVVVYASDAWLHGVWGTYAIATGMFAAHRYGGTTARDAWVVLIAMLASALGAGLAAVPSLAVPELVHSVVLSGGWVSMALGTGAIGATALRRTGRLSALAIGAVAAGSAVALAAAGALIEAVGAPAMVLIAVATAGAGALILAATELGRGWSSTGAIVAATSVTLGAGIAMPRIAPSPETAADPRRVPVAKSLFASVSSSEDDEQHAATRWGAGGRFDVTVAPNGARWLYLDGVPYGVVAPGGRLRPDGALLPFVLAKNLGRVLVVGLGGGQEVRAALEAGATAVVVAEPHPGAVETVTRALASAGGPPLLTNPNVRIVREEARAWLRAGDDRFDLIVVTLASFGAVAEPGRASGATLLTREAIADYLNHLDPEGSLAIRVRDDHELWRTFNTTFQAMALAGSPTPMDAIRHLLAVNDGTAGGTLVDITLPTVFVRKSAFTETDANDVLRFLLDVPFPPLFVPFSESRSVLAVVGTEGGLATAEAGLPFDISPSRDDRPYFQEATKGLPWASIALVLALTTGIAIATWAGGYQQDEFSDIDGASRDFDPPDPRGSNRRPDVGDIVPWRHVAVASAAGVATGTIGSAMLWRLPLIAGRADLTNAAGGAALAIGALAAALVVNRSTPSAVRAVAGWCALSAATTPFILTEALSLSVPLIYGLSLEARVLVGGALLAPIGFGLGAQLPATLRLLSVSGRNGWEGLLWAGLIASASAGTALAHVVSRSLGDSATTALGSVACFGCFLAFGLRWVVGTSADNAPALLHGRPHVR